MSRTCPHIRKHTHARARANPQNNRLCVFRSGSRFIVAKHTRPHTHTHRNMLASDAVPSPPGCMFADNRTEPYADRTMDMDCVSDIGKYAHDASATSANARVRRPSIRHIHPYRIFIAFALASPPQHPPHPYCSFPPLLRTEEIVKSYK